MLLYCASLYLTAFVTYSGIAKSKEFTTKLGQTTAYYENKLTYATVCNNKNQCFTYDLQCRILASSMVLKKKHLRIDPVLEYDPKKGK